MLHLIRLLAGLAALSAVQVNAAPSVPAAPKPAQKASVDTLTCIADYEVAFGLTPKSDPSTREYFDAGAAAATSALAKEKNVKSTDPKFLKDIQDYTQRTARMLETKEISRQNLESQLNICDTRFNP